MAVWPHEPIPLLYLTEIDISHISQEIRLKNQKLERAYISKIIQGMVLHPGIQQACESLRLCF